MHAHFLLFLFFDKKESGGCCSMKKRQLLKQELVDYSKRGIHFQPVKFSQQLIKELLETYEQFGMAEYSYCCHGLERSCWTELVEEGVWDLTLEQVRKAIVDKFKCRKTHLYGSQRFYLYRTETHCFIYLYLRDKVGEDCFLWFGHEDYE